MLSSLLSEFFGLGGYALVGVALGMWLRGRRDDRRARALVLERLSARSSDSVPVADPPVVPVVSELPVVVQAVQVVAPADEWLGV